jgi:hypothetical protein
LVVPVLKSLRQGDHEFIAWLSSETLSQKIKSLKLVPIECVLLLHVKKLDKARCQSFTSVILATWEAKIGRIVVEGQPSQIIYKTPSPK